jgi:hypothetical protein
VDSLNRRARVVAASVLLTMPFALVAAPADPPSARPTAPIAPTGSVHDFDYFLGSGWITHQHRLNAHGTWEDFTGLLCAVAYLNGMATVDELYFPGQGWSGLTLRTFDPQKRLWSVYWVSSRTGTLDPNPEVGGFQGSLGVFYGTDVDARGRPVAVRFQWKIINHDHAHWEQAFSPDGHAWKTNWTADFVRANRASVCRDNRPRHDIGASGHASAD